MVVLVVFCVVIFFLGYIRLFIVFCSISFMCYWLVGLFIWSVGFVLLFCCYWICCIICLVRECFSDERDMFCLCSVMVIIICLFMELCIILMVLEIFVVVRGCMDDWLFDGLWKLLLISMWVISLSGLCCRVGFVIGIWLCIIFVVGGVGGVWCLCFYVLVVWVFVFVLMYSLFWVL